RTGGRDGAKAGRTRVPARVVAGLGGRAPDGHPAVARCRPRARGDGRAAAPARASRHTLLTRGPLLPSGSRSRIPANVCSTHSVPSAPAATLLTSDAPARASFGIEELRWSETRPWKLPSA